MGPVGCSERTQGTIAIGVVGVGGTLAAWLATRILLGERANVVLKVGLPAAALLTGVVWLANGEEGTGDVPIPGPRDPEPPPPPPEENGFAELHNQLLYGREGEVATYFQGHPEQLGAFVTYCQEQGYGELYLPKLFRGLDGVGVGYDQARALLGHTNLPFFLDYIRSWDDGRVAAHYGEEANWAEFASLVKEDHLITRKVIDALEGEPLKALGEALRGQPENRKKVLRKLEKTDKGYVVSAVEVTSFEEFCRFMSIDSWDQKKWVLPYFSHVDHHAELKKWAEGTYGSKIEERARLLKGETGALKVLAQAAKKNEGVLKTVLRLMGAEGYGMTNQAGFAGYCDWIRGWDEPEVLRTCATLDKAELQKLVDEMEFPLFQPNRLVGIACVLKGDSEALKRLCNAMVPRWNGLLDVQHLSFKKSEVKKGLQEGFDAILLNMGEGGFSYWKRAFKGEDFLGFGDRLEWKCTEAIQAHYAVHPEDFEALVGRKEWQPVNTVAKAFKGNQEMLEGLGDACLALPASYFDCPWRGGHLKWICAQMEDSQALKYLADRAARFDVGGNALWKAVMGTRVLDRGLFDQLWAHENLRSYLMRGLNDRSHLPDWFEQISDEMLCEMVEEACLSYPFAKLDKHLDALCCARPQLKEQINGGARALFFGNYRKEHVDLKAAVGILGRNHSTKELLKIGGAYLRPLLTFDVKDFTDEEIGRAGRMAGMPKKDRKHDSDFEPSEQKTKLMPLVTHLQSNC